MVFSTWWMLCLILPRVPFMVNLSGESESCQGRFLGLCLMAVEVIGALRFILQPPCQPPFAPCANPELMILLIA